MIRVRTFLGVAAAAALIGRLFHDPAAKQARINKETENLIGAVYHVLDTEADSGGCGAPQYLQDLAKELWWQVRRHNLPTDLAHRAMSAADTAKAAAQGWTTDLSGAEAR